MSSSLGASRPFLVADATSLKPLPSFPSISVTVSVNTMDLLPGFAGTYLLSAVSDGDDLLDNCTAFVLASDDYLFSSDAFLLNFW